MGVRLACKRLARARDGPIDARSDAPAPMALATAPDGRGQPPGAFKAARLLARSLMLLALCSWAASASEPETKRVLVLFSGESLLPANNALGTSLQAGLKAGAPDRVEVFTEFLDADRFQGAEHAARMAALFREKYATIQIDLTIALGPQALDFLVQHRASLFPGTPLIFAGVSEASLARGLALPNTTGVVSRFDPVQTLELALRLQPGARNLAVVTGAAAFDRNWETVARERFRPYADRLQVTYLSGLPLPDLLRELARLPNHTIVIYLSIFQDGTGERFIPQDLAPRISEAATAPVYSVYETFLGRGIVGGYMDSFEAIGAETARIGLRILAGETAASLPPRDIATQVFMVDWRQLRRWGLASSRLPPGTVVRFEQPSLWDQYRDEILAVAALVVLQSLLIAALLLQARRRRRAEESLRQSEERYRDVVEAQTDLICRYLPDTTLTFVNDPYCRYFGRSRAELVGSKFVELIPEPERAAALRHVASVAARPGARSYEHRVRRTDGSTGWLQWLDHAVRDADSQVVQIQGIGRDITELRRAEIEARERREEVTHLTRVAILGEISGALAHELNQPLTAILSNAQAAQRLLARAPVDLAELAEILEDIVTDDMRAGEVIARLRALLRKGEANLHPLDLNEVTAEVLALARSELIERHVGVSTRLAPGLPRARGDRVQLQQVMLNLLLNGCEAMSATRPAERTLTASTDLNGEGLLLVSIADRGSGIPPDAADRLFEPFFTTKPHGLGLGLSICRSIIAAHGGRLWADNNPDGGATFTFALPPHDGVPH